MSLRARLLGLTLRTTVRPVIAVWTRAPRLPWPYAVVDYAGLLNPVPHGTTFARGDFDGVRVLEVTPAVVRSDRCVVYLPGGAFLVGGRHLHRALLAHVAYRTGARVIAVEYRKLPRHPISASIADCMAVYDAVLRTRPADEVLIMGDSAGGFLAMAMMASVQDLGLPAPAGVVALSPLCEVRADQRQPRRLACSVFGPAAIPAMLKLAAARAAAEYRHPADLQPDDLPPMLLQAARRESLFPEIKRLATQLRECGADCELQSYDLDVHVFQAAPFLPETREALRGLARFCDRAWGAASAAAARAGAQSA